MSTKKRVVQNSFLYTISSILVKAIGFFLLPVYTYFLTLEEYGTVELVTSFLGVGTYIVALSLYSAIIRFYSDYKTNHDMLNRFYSSIINFVFLFSSFLVLLSYFLRDIIASIIFNGVDFFPIILIALLLLIFTSLHQLHSSILQGSQEGKRLTIINLIVFFVTVVFKLLFIVVLDMGTVGFLLSQLIIDVIYVVYFLADLRVKKLYSFTVDFKILVESLLYSIPLILHDISLLIASLFSRILINRNFSISFVGLYSVGMQISSVIDTIQSSVNRAFQPWLFEMLKTNGDKKQIVDFSTVLLILYSFIYMSIGLFSHELLLFITPSRYNLAWTVVPLLIVGFSIKSMYYFFMNIVLYSRGASKKLFLATLTGSISDIIIALFLVPLIGMYGSAIAFIVSKINTVVITVIISKKHLNIGYKVSSMLSVIMPSLIFMGMGLYFSYTIFLTDINFYNILYKIVIFILYILFVFITNRDKLKNALNSINLKSYLLKIRRRKK